MFVVRKGSVEETYSHETYRNKDREREIENLEEDTVKENMRNGSV